MKLYIWKHKDSACLVENLYPVSKKKEVAKNVILPVACHAFFTKKEANKYLDVIGWSDDAKSGYELKTFELK